jgi:hypothetical protein
MKKNHARTNINMKKQMCPGAVAVRQKERTFAERILSSRTQKVHQDTI